MSKFRIRLSKANGETVYALAKELFLPSDPLSPVTHRLESAEKFDSLDAVANWLITAGLLLTPGQPLPRIYTFPRQYSRWEIQEIHG